MAGREIYEDLLVEVATMRRGEIIDQFGTFRGICTWIFRRPTWNPARRITCGTC